MLLIKDHHKLNKILSFKFRQTNGFGQEIEINGKKYKSKYMVAGYINARDVMDHLDDLVGINGWQRKLSFQGGRMFTGISILCEMKEGPAQWIDKWDAGADSNIAKEKGASSDSFKRAGVNWNIGKFLYTLPTLVIETAERKESRQKNNINAYVRSYFEDILKQRAEEHNIELEIKGSKYIQDEDGDNEENEGDGPSGDWGDGDLSPKET